MQWDSVRAQNSLSEWTSTKWVEFSIPPTQHRSFRGGKKDERGKGIKKEKGRKGMEKRGDEGEKNSEGKGNEAFNSHFWLRHRQRAYSVLWIKMRGPGQYTMTSLQRRRRHTPGVYKLRASDRESIINATIIIHSIVRRCSINSSLTIIISMKESPATALQKRRSPVASGPAPDDKDLRQSFRKSEKQVDRLVHAIQSGKDNR